MNRADRRRAAASPVADLAEGARFAQRADPDDPAWVLLTARIPNGGMPPATYTGYAAIDRLRRFCEGWLEGFRERGASSEPFCETEIEVLQEIVREARSRPDVPVVHVIRSWAFSLTRTATGWRLGTALWPRGCGVV